MDEKGLSRFAWRVLNGDLRLSWHEISRTFVGRQWDGTGVPGCGGGGVHVRVGCCWSRMLGSLPGSVGVAFDDEFVRGGVLGVHLGESEVIEYEACCGTVGTFGTVHHGVVDPEW